MGNAPLAAQNIANALFGLQNMTTKHQPVRSLLHALSTAIDHSLCVSTTSTNTQPLSSSSSSSSHPQWSHVNAFTAQSVGNSFYGLQGMSSEVLETRLVLRALTRKVREMPSLETLRAFMLASQEQNDLQKKDAEPPHQQVNISNYILSGQNIGNALWGFKNMKIIPQSPSSSSITSITNIEIENDDDDVEQALTALSVKIKESTAVMSGQNFGNAFYALHAMDCDSPAVKSVLSSLAHKLVASQKPFSGLDIGNNNSIHIPILIYYHF